MAKPSIEQMEEFWQQVHNGRITKENLQHFIRTPSVHSRFSLFDIEVDYGQTFDQMVEAGNYDWVNDDITSVHFPVQGGKGVLNFKVELVNMGRVATTEELLEEAKKRGLTRPGIEHILAFGAKFPEIQREFPIVALIEKPWRDPHGRLNVPELWYNGDKRKLNDKLDMWWDDCDRFLFLLDM